jgi:RimJ/RimL family protein N-acetyltransferase
MSHYNILPQSVYTEGLYLLRALRAADMSAIKDWRNAQMDVLRQKTVLTDEDQHRYYQLTVKPTFDMQQPPLVLFGYEYDGTLIGYGGLTNLDWTSLRAEVSFLVETERAKNLPQYEIDFRHFLRLLKRIAFQELGLNRLFTETYDIRPWHIRILESEGFLFEGRMRQHVKIDGRYVDSLLHGCLKEQLHVSG